MAIMFSPSVLSRLKGAAVLLSFILCACATTAATDHSVAEVAAPKSPVSPLGAYLSARFAQSDRDYREAAKFMSVTLAADPGNLGLKRQAFLYRIGAGEIGRALPLARQIADLDRHSGFAALVLVLQELKSKHYAEAVTQAKSLPHDGAQRLAAPLLEAWADVGLGKAKAALELLKNTTGPNTLPALTELHRALIADAADQIDEAARLYAAITGDGEHLTWRTVELAGNFYERHQRIAQARRLYRTLSRDIESGAVADAAMKRMAAGRIPPRLIASPQDGAAEVMFDIASILNQRSTLDAALFYTRLALYLRPNFPIGQLLLAEIVDQQGHQRAALALYRAVDPASPLSWSAQLREAAMMEQLGQTDAAVTLLRRLAAERPKDREPLVELGDVLRSHERYAEAVKAYDGALALIHHPQASDWRLYYSRGVALERSKQWPRAEADLKHALKLQPQQPLVLNYLGYSWIDQGVHLDEALHMVARAVALRPDDGYIVDSLGWAYYRLGNYAKATENLEHAVELVPEDPTINDHLGDVYWRTGRHREARYQWNRALLFKPDPKETHRIEAKLEHGLGAPHVITPAKGG